MHTCGRRTDTTLWTSPREAPCKVNCRPICQSKRGKTKVSLIFINILHDGKNLVVSGHRIPLRMLLRPKPRNSPTALGSDLMDEWCQKRSNDALDYAEHSQRIQAKYFVVLVSESVQKIQNRSTQDQLPLRAPAQQRRDIPSSKWSFRCSYFTKIFLKIFLKMIVI